MAALLDHIAPEGNSTASIVKHRPGVSRTTPGGEIIRLLKPRDGRIWLNETDILWLPARRTVGLGMSLAPEGLAAFGIHRAQLADAPGR